MTKQICPDRLMKKSQSSQPEEQLCHLLRNTDFEGIEKRTAPRLSKLTVLEATLYCPAWRVQLRARKGLKMVKYSYSLKYAKFNGRLLSVIEFENLMAQYKIMGSCDIKLVHPGWIKGQCVALGFHMFPICQQQNYCFMEKTSYFHRINLEFNMHQNGNS